MCCIQSSVASSTGDLSNATNTPSSFITTGSFTDARHGMLNNVGHNQYNITYANQSCEVKEILATLKPVEREGYYVPPCMEGTRKKIFKSIDQWLDDTHAPNVLWISGNPGAGKSGPAWCLGSRSGACWYPASFSHTETWD